LRLAAALETDLDVITGEFDRLPLTDPLREAEWWAGPEFAHWVDGARGRLRRSAEDALRRAVGDFRRQGQTALVHAAAAVLYQLDPLSDTAVHALAERDLMAGDVVGAIRLLRAHLAGVQDALGCAPHRDVERLLRRLEAGSHPPVELVPARLAAEASTLRPSVFVGREKELALLEAEWQRAGEGGLRSCLILGPAGIGKSSLVRRFAATVAARAQPVFVVTCQEIGEGIPFAALADLVTALSRDPSVSGTDPTWLAEVARVHPGLRLQYPGIPEAPEAPADSIRLRVAEGLLHVLDAVSDGTRVGIVFDDLPFMDPATRDVLHVLARRLSDRRVFLLATARTFELLGSAPPALPVMSIIRWSSELRLIALSPESTRQLAATLSPRLADERRVLQRIERISDGNPHFAEMLVADWEAHASASLAAGRSADALPEDWQPPDSLRQAFAQIYAHLDEAAQEVLHVLAVAGRSLLPDELSNSLVSQRLVLNEALFDLLRRGIVRLDCGSWTFKNELHRAYVYYAITAELRRFFHSRLGKSLLNRGSTNYSFQLEAAQHLEKAGLHSEAADVVVRAAHLAIENGAPAEAEAALRSVLTNSHPTFVTAQLELALAESLSAQGRYGETLSVLDRASQGLPEVTAKAVVAFLRAQALQRIRSSDDQTIQSATEHALEVVSAGGEDRLLAATVQIAAEAASEIGIPEMLARAAELTARLERSARNDVTRARALLTHGFCSLTAGRFEESLHILSESVGLLWANRLDSDRVRALNGTGVCLMALGRYNEAVTAFATSARVAYRLNDLVQVGTLLANAGCVYEEVGMFAEAEACYLNAVAHIPIDSNPRAAVTSRVSAIQAALVRGDFDSAISWATSAREAAVKTQSWRLRALVDFCHADVFLAIGEPEHAWPLVARAAPLTWGKERSLDTNGKQVRLTLHLALTSGGPSRLKSLVGELLSRPRPLRLAHALEVAGFLEWAARSGGIERQYVREAGFNLDLSLLPGPVAFLAAAGICPREEWTCLPGESPLQMIERTFPRNAEHMVRSIQEILPVPTGNRGSTQAVD
jgi:tetratricopeptide (TPR) repeat protein